MTGVRRLPAIAAVHTIAVDFDGVLTDNGVWVNQDGTESVRCDRGDGLGFDLLRAFQQRKILQADVFILSREGNPVVAARAKKLKVRCQRASLDKLSFMRNYLAKRFPALRDPFKGVIYIGNDLNDLALLRKVGYAVVPCDAHHRVKRVAALELEQRGGHGAFRGFVERFLRIGNLNEVELDELISNR